MEKKFQKNMKRKRGFLEEPYKGRNDIIISLKAIRNVGFWLDFFNEDRVEISIERVDKNGKPIPFAGFGMRGTDYFQTGGSTDLNGYAEKTFRLRGENDEFILFVDGREDRYASKVINNLKPGSREKYKIIVGEVPSIEGSVLSLDGKNPQPGTIVRANLIGSKRTIPITVTSAGKDGSYQFDNLPFGKYELFVSYPDKDYYLKDENGKRKIFNIKLGAKSYVNADFKTPTPDRGRWENVDYLDGLLSNWVSDIIIDDNNNIWFACWTGISIFNGIEMKNLTPKDGLPSRPIFKLFMDSKGNVWAGASTDNKSDLSLVRIDPDFNVTPYYFSDKVPIMGITSIVEDEYGRMIFGGGAGLTILEEGKFTNYNYADGVGSGTVLSILLEGNNMWLGTQMDWFFTMGKSLKHMILLMAFQLIPLMV